MKLVLIPLALAAMVSAALANTAPTPVIVSAAMRANTTLMDVVYRVNDPDDATVKVRALAFVDGVRSFANVLRPVTFVEGTASKIGDTIASNTNHTLTWDVGADWNIDLGQVKFEILCRDARGLLAFDWITIPAAAGNPALTISKDAPSDASVLSALFWQYADGDAGLTLTNGVLRGNANSGNFVSFVLANGTSLQNYSAPYIFKQMNIDPASASDVNFAANTARADLISTSQWHAANRTYGGLSMLSWLTESIPILPAGLTNVTAIAVGTNHSLALMSDGTVVDWNHYPYSQNTTPVGLSGVTAIAVGDTHSLALKSNGTVVGWGGNGLGQTTIPVGLNGVTAIAAGSNHSLALKTDGTVVCWGNNNFGQAASPVGLTGVIAIAGGIYHSYALKSDGTIVGWGWNLYGQTTIQAGLTGVTAIAAGGNFTLVLKSNGTVVGWGDNYYGQATIPAGLTGVTAIAAGQSHCLALKNDGTIVGWGQFSPVTAGLSGVTAISAGGTRNLALKPKAP